jgi:hypothetical protein
LCSLGNGWYAQSSVNVGPVALKAMLSVTTSDGATTYFPTTLSGEGLSA